MRVVGREVLEKFIARHEDVRSEANAWLAEVREAQWSSFQDIRQRYTDASFVKKHVIFNLRRNRYRLDTVVAYNTKVVVIVRVGTHAEYDRWVF